MYKKTLNKELLGEMLTELRLNKGVTATKVIETLQLQGVKCSKTAYSDYEYGKRFPPLEVLYGLCEYYNVSLEYLLFGTVDDIDTSVRKILKFCTKDDAKTLCSFFGQLLPVLEQLANTK